MRLLNDLLNLHDGFDDEGWMKECKKRMVNTFPREDPFSILVPAGFDIDKVYQKCIVVWILIKKNWNVLINKTMKLSSCHIIQMIVKFHVICPNTLLTIAGFRIQSPLNHLTSVWE